MLPIPSTDDKGPPERLRRAVRAWTCISSTGQNLGKQQAQQQEQVQQVQQSRHYKHNDDNRYY
jgi:hypothetical protein